MAEEKQGEDEEPGGQKTDRSGSWEDDDEEADD